MKTQTLAGSQTECILQSFKKLSRNLQMQILKHKKKWMGKRLGWLVASPPRVGNARNKQPRNNTRRHRSEPAVPSDFTVTVKHSRSATAVGLCDVSEHASALLKISRSTRISRAFFKRRSTNLRIISKKRRKTLITYWRILPFKKACAHARPRGGSHPHAYFRRP